MFNLHKSKIAVIPDSFTYISRSELGRDAIFQSLLMYSCFRVCGHNLLDTI